MQLRLEKKKTSLWKCFGEDICSLVLGSQISHAKMLHFDLFPHEVVVYFNVFRLGMKNGIDSEISHTTE